MAARILAIDDDQDTLELYRVALEAEGYQVDLSSPPFEDIREVVRLQPDLILLDARIPRDAQRVSEEGEKALKDWQRRQECVFLRENE